jgi:DNA-binding CsgD family transcriptional regulator/tetratricopeptide (TPR) repeat protein
MRAHAEYFLALADDAEPELFGPQEAEWFERLEEEHDNIRVALSWSLEGADPELGLRLAGAIWWFWWWRGHYSEGQKWLQQALAKDDGASAIARAKALGGVGWLANRRGDLHLMRESATEGLRLCDEAGLADNHRALFLRVLGSASWLERDFERARQLVEESLALSREANDVQGMVHSLVILGDASDLPADQEQAKEFYEEGLALLREYGSTSWRRYFLNDLGMTLMLVGDLERATALFEEAAELLREVGSRVGLEFPLGNLGWVALMLEDLERADALHKESLALCREVGDKALVSDRLERLACVAGAGGEAERAARLFGAAGALREAIGVPPDPPMRTLEEPFLLGARSQLEEGAWTKAWEEGQAMSMDRAIDYALSEEEPSMTTPSSTSEQRSAPAPEQPAGLTSREVEVLGLVATGLTNAQVAQKLFLSPRTVQRHLNSIYHKLGVSSRTAATRFAIDHGLL